jgi:hypothetical protein
MRQNSEQNEIPAGHTADLTIEVLNVGKSDVYLLKGEAYLDPNLNAVWQLVHSESMDNFHLGYLQSAIWTFGLAMPSKIQAANATNGVPQVDLLIKIVYLLAGEPQNVEQATFGLGVPGATLQGSYNLIWLALTGAIFTFSITGFYTVAKRRRRL